MLGSLLCIALSSCCSFLGSLFVVDFFVGGLPLLFDGLLLWPACVLVSLCLSFVSCLAVLFLLETPPGTASSLSCYFDVLLPSSSVRSLAVADAPSVSRLFVALRFCCVFCLCLVVGVAVCFESLVVVGVRGGFCFCSSHCFAERVCVCVYVCRSSRGFFKHTSSTINSWRPEELSRPSRKSQ